MADVLFVCVREDAERAESLAEKLVPSGISVSGAPRGDEPLKVDGAAIVIWSGASIRSRAFLAAARRVIKTRKAVFACLIEPPPPSSLEASPAFDLSDWGEGDVAASAAMDKLVAAVEGMVRVARVADEIANKIKPYQLAPQQVTVRASVPSCGSYEALRFETDFWRAIRSSRRASDFSDYLECFGPGGLYFELAEMRLQELERRLPMRLRLPQARARSEEAPKGDEIPPPAKPRKRARAKRKTASPSSPRVAAAAALVSLGVLAAAHFAGTGEADQPLHAPVVHTAIPSNLEAAAPRVRFDEVALADLDASLQPLAAPPPEAPRAEGSRVVRVSKVRGARMNAGAEFAPTILSEEALSLTRDVLAPMSELGGDAPAPDVTAAAPLRDPGKA